MDQNQFNTDEAVRKSGSHLTLAERGMIQALHKEGMSLRGIAKSVGCAHTTIYYELKRGTPPRKSNRGRIPGYTAKRGQEAYAANRKYVKYISLYSYLREMTRTSESFESTIHVYPLSRFAAAPPKGGALIS
jgi:IS30 family transposase